MSDNDLELLARYTRDGAEDAFTEIVRRHLNLVYSAALRQVRAPQLAEEVAQSVFADLAKNANDLAPDTILAAWLYQVTRRSAIDVVRRESRRQLREQVASEMNAMNATSADWTRIEPLLDDAMQSLDEKDRAAILLRYFESKSLRDVGQALGTGEDAAQKRVSRAVGRLRDFFSKRGAAVGTGGIVAAIGANAVEAAPVGLALKITGSAALAGGVTATAATSAASQTIVMTAIQKTIIGATLVTAVATGFYEAQQASHFREKAEALEIQRAEDIRQWRRNQEKAEARIAAIQGTADQLRLNNAELARLRGEAPGLRRDSQSLARLKSARDKATPGSAVESWASRARELKEQLAQTPEAAIPEFQFLTEEDWLAAARKNLDGEANMRRAFSEVRGAGERKFVSLLSKALKKYSDDNGKQPPTDLSQLQGYFEERLDESILQRWEIAPAETVPTVGFGGEVIITQKAAVDDVFDTRYVVGPNGGHGSTSFLTDLTRDTLNPVYQEYYATSDGKRPQDPAQLLPFVTTLEQQAAVQKLIMRASVTN